MASVADERRPSMILTLITLVVVVLVGLLALRWITSVVLAIVQLGLVLIALYLVARVGWYLLRQGGPRA